MNKKLSVFLDLILVTTLFFILISFYESIEIDNHSTEILIFGILTLMIIVLFFNWFDKLEKKKWVYYAIIAGIFILGLILIYLINQMQYN